MIVDVFIETRYSPIDIVYSYRTMDSSIVPGIRVVVPFGRGNRTVIALVLKTREGDESKLKEVLEKVDVEPILTEDLIQLGDWISKTYSVGYNRAFSPILPPGDIKEIVYNYIPLDENIVLEEISEGELSKLVSEGKILKKYSVKTSKSIKTQKEIRLKDNYFDAFNQGRELTEAQKKVLEYFIEKKSALRSTALKELGVSTSPIKTLINRGFLEEKTVKIIVEPYENTTKYPQIPLNLDQLRAIEEVNASKNTTHLLMGVTGSGKTEVYLHLAREVVEKGGQIIVLVPEIGLTPQMIERFKGRFGNRVSVLHSKLSTGQRLSEWLKIKNGEVDIVVGVRSGIFAPFERLKMIIIDEEHDSSYNFHQGLRYDTKEVASKRMELLGGKLLLGSATPSISTYYQVEESNISVSYLKKRANSLALMPSTKIVDMRQELVNGNTSIFSNKLYNLMKETLERKEQIILFLNRRGYSNFISCRSCGYVVKCSSCDISMNYHRTINRLRCHYCGKTREVPKVCPECGSKYIKDFGIGTQKVEDEVLKYFPGTRVIRMDRDTTIKKDSFDSIFNSFKNNEADVLIGTQMISKGLDFENVTLVGVIAADLSLYISSYDSHERTFQLITQVSGRAGRGKKKGNVVIQSYSPEDYAIVSAARGDYMEFYNREIEIRRVLNYPPFSKVGTVEFSSLKETVQRGAEEFLNSLSENLDGLSVESTRIIDLPKIRDNYRCKVTLKCKHSEMAMLNEVINRVLENYNGRTKEEIYVNIEY